jgi:AraC-like DNA-binding protein/ligand-binding sensor protein
MSLAVAQPRKNQLVEQLRRSQVYRDYARAFREATGLPLALKERGSFNLPHHGDPNENPFCARMAGSNHSCARCLELQRGLEDQAMAETKTVNCFAGLADSAVPVRVGEKLVAYLQTGQILLRPPTPAGLARLEEMLESLGIGEERVQLVQTFSQTRVITRAHYQSILQLLTIFAQHLSSLSNQLVVREEASELPAIRAARTYITEHHAEELTLAQVAQAVNMSPFYFCKTFRRSTGLTFTDYVARVRVEVVRQMLLDPNKRVSEAAFAAGFQSLSQFNRVFRRISGESPSAYREKLH